MARKKPEDTALTRQALLDAAVDLFLEQGVTRTTLAQIAERAGHTRGAIYHHFRNKEQIVAELIQSVALPFDDIFNEQSRRCIKQFQANLLATLLKIHRDQYRRRIHTIIYHRCEFVAELNPVYQETIQSSVQKLHDTEEIYRYAQEVGELPRGNDPRQLAFFTQSFFMGLYWNCLREPWSTTFEVDLELAVRVFFHGLLVPSPAASA